MIFCHGQGPMSTDICVGTDDSGDFHKDVSQKNWREHSKGDKCPINWLYKSLNQLKLAPEIWSNILINFLYLSPRFLYKYKETSRDLVYLDLSWDVASIKKVTTSEAKGKSIFFFLVGRSNLAEANTWSPPTARPGRLWGVTDLDNIKLVINIVY